MILLNQQIELAESTEDVLRIIADAWRTGGCPDTAYAIEDHIRAHSQEEVLIIEELKFEHAEEIEKLKSEHAEEIKELEEKNQPG